MITFSTEFPIDPKNSVRDVLRLACSSIVSSPHTKIPKDALDAIPTEGETHYELGDERVVYGVATDGDLQIAGVRYLQIDNSLEWAIVMVTTKTLEQHLVSVLVSCEALSTAVRLPSPKKPYFIRQALGRLGGGMDGEIPVTDTPFVLTEGEVSIAAALISGTGRNRLPIAYISMGFDGSYIVDPKELARWLSGTAHVFVEPSRTFSVALKPLVQSRNVYGGTVGVYWPESSARRTYYRSTSGQTAEVLQSEIANDIRLALANRRQRSNCNWLHLQETISRLRYEKLKSQGSTEVDKYIEAFDEDLRAKESRLAEAENEIARLNVEIRKYDAMSASASAGLVQRGEEHDLYENEIRDLIIDALRDALRTSQDGSRRSHVYSDLLNENVSSGNGEQQREEIKSIFKSYKSMDAKTRSALTKLGFELTEDGKHIKAVFQGDGRYTFSIPKTGSDRRGGRNMASDINKTIF